MFAFNQFFSTYLTNKLKESCLINLNLTLSFCDKGSFSLLLILLDHHEHFTGICRETGEMFMVKCPNRKKDTLIRLICEHVAEGTTIYTDGWQSYRTLGEINGYKVTL